MKDRVQTPPPEAFPESLLSPQVPETRGVRDGAWKQSWEDPESVLELKFGLGRWFVVVGVVCFGFFVWLVRSLGFGGFFLLFFY